MAETTRTTPRSEQKRKTHQLENNQDCVQTEPDAEEDWHRQKARLIDEILSKMEKRLLQEQSLKVSVGDFIRLLELRKGLEEERPREITVRWVEPSEMENAPA